MNLEGRNGELKEQKFSEGSSGWCPLGRSDRLVSQNLLLPFFQGMDKRLPRYYHVFMAP
jgi:hypothetical protein